MHNLPPLLFHVLGFPHVSMLFSYVGSEEVAMLHLRHYFGKLRPEFPLY